MDNHDHSHDHHGHDGHHPSDAHPHAHAPQDFGRAFLIGIALNTGFVVIEAVYGILANSMALLADAGHNLSDVFGLLVAWGAATLGKRAPTPRYTYGLRSSSILAALANAILLLIAVGAITWEAIGRFSAPEAVASQTVMMVAAIGIAINAATAWLFMSGRDDDLNIKGAYLHMAADAAVSLGVVVAAAIILATGWLWIDPLVSLAIAAVIVWGTWGLLRDAATLAVHGVPSGISTSDVRQALVTLPGVSSIHDLHIWAISTTETALTCHLVMPEGCPSDGFLASCARLLADRFKINHVTLQIERGGGVACALLPDTVV
ncbi:MAG: cation transporter [Hyphomicrobium sp.]|nr:cation transporter [Hyphomicrobium sp.]